MIRHVRTAMAAVRLSILYLLSLSAVYGQNVRPGNSWMSKSQIENSTKGPICQISDHGAPCAGKRFVVTDYGVERDSVRVQTSAIQKVIDLAAEENGTVVIPEGTFLSGALFFRQGTRLHLERGARLKGSDDIADFPIVDTRIEGRSVRYFAALVNADAADGFAITGEGTIDGNGLRYWRSFWLRREVDPECTNMDELRPRLVYISNSRDVRIEGATLQNSPFWTTHLYRCEHVRITRCRIFAPAEPVRAPSCDAVDIDACTDVRISGCRISVNDDAIALKGGKGPDAPDDPANGPDCDIIIEDCEFGFCHSALTCGSEAIHCTRIVMRRCTVDRADRLLWLKMRPDTPQLYENITVEEISGNARTMLYIRPWTQFFDLKGHTEIPISYARGIVLRCIDLDCETLFDTERADGEFILSDLTFDRLRVRAADTSLHEECVRGLRVIDCRIEKTQRKAAAR